MATQPRESDGVTLSSVPVSSAPTPSAVTTPSAETKTLGEVLLRLHNVEKHFVIENSDEPVRALCGISLYETDENSDNNSNDYAAGNTGEGRKEGSVLTGSRAVQRRSPLASSEIVFQPVRRGEFVMIRGPSGGGKTTLLNIIGTLDSPTKGEVELMGKRVDKHTSDEALAELRLKHLGFVFQTFNLIATMTAAENVELPMTLAGTLTAKERRLRARQLLALVGLRNRVDHLPSELSGGEQQRVTIARSLANNPSLLLLDEPTGDLDTATTIDVMNLLLRLNMRTRVSCIMVTHNADVECYADRILFVSDGKFVREVINTEPRQLDTARYMEYLQRREAQMTTAPLKRDL